VDRNFDRLSTQLINFAQQAAAETIVSDGKIPAMVAIATHDEKRIEHAITSAGEAGLPKQALEFQMLHGIRTDLCTHLIKEGYPVRVYVPFGTQWYPYFVRRLAERPANLWFFLTNLFRIKGHFS
jgi:proline dehydrogenase